LEDELEGLANNLSQRVQIGLDQAKTVLNQVSKTVLRKADPDKASKLLSKLPPGITNLFSSEEKNKFTTTKDEISNEQVIENIDRESGIHNKAKSQKATQEAVKLLEEKTDEPGLIDNIMGRFKNVDLNPFDNR
jgi:phosphoribosylanthranilate isomerase